MRRASIRSATSRRERNRMSRTYHTSPPPTTATAPSSTRCRGGRASTGSILAASPRTSTATHRACAQEAVQDQAPGSERNGSAGRPAQDEQRHLDERDSLRLQVEEVQARLPDRQGRDAPDLPPRRGCRRLPAQGGRHRDEPGWVSQGNVCEVVGGAEGHIEQAPSTGSTTPVTPTPSRAPSEAREPRVSDARARGRALRY